ncbi:type VI secretion system baseplate subunit TssK, partial [Corallococcus exiguus]|uniref:type VI secretion system baseplate subunit TssK n=1 Tax=Corallococcus exiguus TaxID=83462 RepID=UPI001560E052
PLDGVKLASPTRLPLVRRQALKGVPFKHVPYPSFPHALGPEIDWYLLSNGEEWQHALREDGLSFYVTPALRGAQTSLFWRRS